VSDLFGGGFHEFFQDLAWKTTNHALKKRLQLEHAPINESKIVRKYSDMEHMG